MKKIVYLTWLLLVLVSAELTAQPRFDMERLARIQFDDIVVPVLKKYADDKTVPKGIQERLAKFLELINSEPRAFHYEISNKCPVSGGGATAVWAFDKNTSSELLEICLPKLMSLYYNNDKKMFEEEVVLVFAHEFLHYELHQSGRFPISEQTAKNPNLIYKGEATAWGITILEMIRPWIKVGRKLENQSLIKMSEAFRNFGDNYEDPRWIKLISQMFSGGNR